MFGKKLFALIFVVIILSTSASAFFNRFDPYQDLNNVDWFYRGLYDGAQKYEPCLDLREFNAVADSDPFDHIDRDDIKKKNNLNRLSYEDYLVVANQDKFDNIDPDDWDDMNDFKCSTYGEYKDFASQNPSDQWDDDDFFQYYGFDDERDFNDYKVHSTKEYYPVKRSFAPNPQYKAPQYIDSRGGLVSWFRFS